MAHSTQTQREEQSTQKGANGNSSPHAFDATVGMLERTRTWLRMTGAGLDEADRQIEDGLRLLGKIHEQVAVSRRNLLQFTEELTVNLMASAGVR